MHGGQCRDLYEEGICGLGERLFLIDGNVECDCDEVKYRYHFGLFRNDSQGWLRYEGRCYQEFTPAFCGGNKILNLGTRKRLRDGETYSCVSNPCRHQENMLPHR